MLTSKSSLRTNVELQQFSYERRAKHRLSPPLFFVEKCGGEEAVHLVGEARVEWVGRSESYATPKKRSTVGSLCDLP